MLFMLFLPVYLTILTVTVLAVVKSWKKSIRNEFKNNDELSDWVIIWGALFTTAAPLIGFMRFDAYGPEMPFSKQHVLVIELLVVVSAVCYWVSKFAKKKVSPFVNLLLRAGLIQGIILDVIVTIHFGHYMGMGLLFPMFGFELLAPPIAMMFLLYELTCNFRTPKQKAEPLFFIDKILPLHLGAVIVLVFVQQAALIPAGFHWNSLVLAFTESKGFIFSHGFNYLQ
jgi:hypothetical protein